MSDLAVSAAPGAAALNIANSLIGRWRGLTVLLLAAAVGLVSALVVALVGWLTSQLHSLLFLLPANERLSEQSALATPALALVPVLGGAALAVSIALARRFRTRPPVDPIEANAVHGGRMSFRESLIVTLQTVLSTSFGASVGLEAGYTQMSASLASHAGVRLNLRRNEVRMLVGCGAAGAIAAAFNAPFTGAFYAFELIIGVYSVGLLAPLVTASLVATFVARWLGSGQMPITLDQVNPLSGTDVLPFVILGAVSSGIAIAIMLTVAQIERGLSLARIPQASRPVIGGLVMGGLALATPQVLSSGHGALGLQLASAGSLLTVGLLFVLKFVASATSLGTGFRGGLFFASLLLGALLGKLYAGILLATGLAPHIDIELAAVVGMASLASGIIGGPLTMSFLVLEATGDLNISAAVLVAAAISAFLVRELFGYSFSTWRLHLRGESIRSAHDVGRVRNLTVASMMRADVKTVSDRMPLGEFRAAFPLGSTERVVGIDRAGRYAGIMLVADAYQPEIEAKAPDGAIEPLLRYRDRFLLPGLNVADAAQVFQRAESEELAVLDNLGNRHVVGLLTEKHLLRRYAEELDKGLKDLTG
ncbi:MAG TPA: chloride channel protein [Devosia sp.]|jgi:CIC family chloride channel protein|nr:chloride channel protein [Devosia sp.]